MSEKHLKTLKEQKKLIEGHLAWLNNEIAQIEGSEPTSMPVDAPSKDRLPTYAATRPETAALAREPNPIEEVYDTIGPDSKGAAADAKRGCLLFFLAAFGLLAAGTAGIYLFY